MLRRNVLSLFFLKIITIIYFGRGEGWGGGSRGRTELREGHDSVAD